MSYAHCSLVLSSFNTIDFAQNAEASVHSRSHEHAHTFMNTSTHECLRKRMLGMSYAHCSLVFASFNTVNFALNAEAYADPRSHEHVHALMNSPRFRHLKAKTKRHIHAYT